MNTALHTILGANGAIGSKLAKELAGYSTRIRVASRQPKPVNPQDEVMQADLLDENQTLAAVSGSAVVYLTVGLPYNTSVWQQQWPVVMRNVIKACQQHSASLVFFDNVYALGHVQGPMTEQSPLNPRSKKGELRAQLVRMLQDAQAGGLPVIIARAPDFYGPATTLSVLNMMALQRMAAGQRAQVMLRADLPHSYIYTPDAARAVALLGHTPSAFNQVWHLPTATPAPTHIELVQLAAQHLGRPAQHMLVPKWMLNGMGWFVPPVREMRELYYQLEQPYVFDSSKFCQAFNYTPVPYAQGIAETLDSMRV